MRWAGLLLLACSVLACCSTCFLASSRAQAEQISPSINQSKEPHQPSGPPLRQRLKLPNLFKFEQFKRIFRKHYRSLVEELVRRKIYLGRAFCAFISVVKYLHFRQDYYLAVSKRSDQTPQERQRWRLDAAKLDAFVANHSQQQQQQHQQQQLKLASMPPPAHMKRPTATATATEIPVAEPKDIKSELEEIERHKKEPGYREMAQEIRELQQLEEADVDSDSFDHDIGQALELPEVLPRRRRSIYPEQLDFGVNMNAAASLVAKGRHLNGVAHDKPHKKLPPVAPPMVASAKPERVGDEEEEEEEGGKSSTSLPGQVVSLILKLPGAEYLNSLVKAAVASDQPQSQADGNDHTTSHNPEEPVITRRRRKEKRADKVFVDMRESGCLGEPGDQGDCGACYAFAVVALYEYLYCGATGHLVAFSPQYMVSCGARGGLNHCEGAGMSAALKYVDNYGLELLQDQPYLEADGTCPYGDEHLGQIRADERGFGYVPFENFDLYLQSRPIFFALNAPDDFDDYGGGVHSGSGCQSVDAHGMLIVGHGREDGQEYYLFRNSYGQDWGEQGYFKFRKESIRDCSSYKFGFASLAQFRSDHFERLAKQRPQIKSLDLNSSTDADAGGDEDEEFIDAEMAEEEEGEEEEEEEEEEEGEEEAAAAPSDAELEAERKRKRRRRKSEQRRRRRQRKALAGLPAEVVAAR